MGNLNWKSLLLGGLLAGVVINALEFLQFFLLADRFTPRMEELGLETEITAPLAVVGVAMGFVFGIGAVWLYASIRPRYGAGVKTAVCAGIAVWFFAVLLNSIGFAISGLFSTELMLIGAVWELIELPLATTAGAWLYKEE